LLLVLSFPLLGVPVAKRGPVLVELFTSEGCSSCPPADALLRELDGSGDPEVIALGEHVDYWNQLGWVDPFSSAAFSRRQEDYARRLGGGGVYTPQLVVDGRREMVGSDRAQVHRALAEAADQAKLPVALMARLVSPARLQVQVEADVAGAAGAAEAFLALTEGPLESRVPRGENAGRVLTHAAVVRKWLELGPVAATGGHYRAAPSVELDPGWRPERMKVVVFIQERGTGQVLGAASARLDQAE